MLTNLRGRWFRKKREKGNSLLTVNCKFNITPANFQISNDKKYYPANL